MLKPLLLSLTIAFFAFSANNEAQASDCLPVETIINNLLDDGNYDEVTLLNPMQAERYILAFLHELPSGLGQFELLIARDVKRNMYTIETIINGLGCADVWVSPPHHFQHGMAAAIGQPI